MKQLPPAINVDRDESLLTLLKRQDLALDERVAALVTHLTQTGRVPAGGDFLWSELARSPLETRGDGALLLLAFCQLAPQALAKVGATVEARHLDTYLVGIVDACRRNMQLAPALSSIVGRIDEKTFCAFVRGHMALISNRYPPKEPQLARRLVQLLAALPDDPARFDDRLSTLRTASALLPTGRHRIGVWRSVKESLDLLRQAKTHESRRLFRCGVRKESEQALQTMCDALLKAIPPNTQRGLTYADQRIAAAEALLQHAGVQIDQLPDRTAEKFRQRLAGGAWAIAPSLARPVPVPPPAAKPAKAAAPERVIEATLAIAASQPPAASTAPPRAQLQQVAGQASAFARHNNSTLAAELRKLIGGIPLHRKLATLATFVVMLALVGIGLASLSLPKSETAAANAVTSADEEIANEAPSAENPTSGAESSPVSPSDLWGPDAIDPATEVPLPPDQPEGSGEADPPRSEPRTSNPTEMPPDDTEVAKINPDEIKPPSPNDASQDVLAEVSFNALLASSNTRDEVIDIADVPFGEYELNLHGLDIVNNAFKYERQRNVLAASDDDITCKVDIVDGKVNVSAVRSRGRTTLLSLEIAAGKLQGKLVKQRNDDHSNLQKLLRFCVVEVAPKKSGPSRFIALCQPHSFQSLIEGEAWKFRMVDLPTNEGDPKLFLQSVRLSRKENTDLFASNVSDVSDVSLTQRSNIVAMPSALAIRTNLDSVAVQMAATHLEVSFSLVTSPTPTEVEEERRRLIIERDKERRPLEEKRARISKLLNDVSISFSTLNSETTLDACARAATSLAEEIGVNPAVIPRPPTLDPTNKIRTSEELSRFLLPIATKVREPAIQMQRMLDHQIGAIDDKYSLSKPPGDPRKAYTHLSAEIYRVIDADGQPVRVLVTAHPTN